jgi:F420-non-reducing hydrogenase small subunit
MLEKLFGQKKQKAEQEQEVKQESQKVKTAFYWATSCGGCEEAILDVREKLFDVLDKIDILFWPVAVDTKYSDVEALEDKLLDAVFINGGISNIEQKEVVKLLRKKAKAVIAFGSCAHMGGIPGLRNLYSIEDGLERVYFTTPSTYNPERALPSEKSELPGGGEVTLPPLLPNVLPLEEVISVDFYVPGCPPLPETILKALEVLLSGDIPEDNVLGAESKSLCNFCDRNQSKPENLSVERYYRVHEKAIPPDKCLLAEGVICLGPVTRGGCGEKCINVNMPCRGCYGPLPDIDDMGLRFLSNIASITCAGEESTDESKMRDAIATIKDPVGTFYRFSYPDSSINKLVRRR